MRRQSGFRKSRSRLCTASAALEAAVVVRDALREIVRVKEVQDNTLKARLRTVHAARAVNRENQCFRSRTNKNDCMHEEI